METKKQIIERLQDMIEKGLDPSPYTMSRDIDALEFRRDQYRLNQEEFAALLKVDPTHYSEFKHCKRALPVQAIQRAIIIGVPMRCAFNSVYRLKKAN